MDINVSEPDPELSVVDKRFEWNNLNLSNDIIDRGVVNTVSLVTLRGHLIITFAVVI